MPEPLAAFRGPVRIECGAGPLPLTLRGAERAGGAPLTLAFAGASPAGIPASLEDVEVRPAGAGAYLIVSGAHAYPLAAQALHYCRDAAAEFYRALPPRPVPLGKRLFWRVVLTLARSRAGLKLLGALRR